VLRLLAEIAVAHCLGSELPLGGPRPGALNFIAVDSFVRLLCTLIRCAPRVFLRLFGTGGATTSYRTCCGLSDGLLLISENLKVSG